MLEQPGLPVQHEDTHPMPFPQMPDKPKSPLPSNTTIPSPLNQELDASSPSPSLNEEQIQGVQLRPTRSAKQTPRSHRFSLMKFRHASDPNLSASYSDAEAPPIPNVPMPTIITTSPTVTTVDGSSKRKNRNKFFGRSRPRLEDESARKKLQGKAKASSHDGGTQAGPRTPTPNTSTFSQRFKHSFDKPARPSLTSPTAEPPPYGDESNSSLALPVSRLSDSSRSDGSSGDHGIYAQTTTTHTISTTTTFFKLPRRKKDKGPLFPLPVRIPPPDGQSNNLQTPRVSTSGRNSESMARQSPGVTPLTAIRRPQSAEDREGGYVSPVPSPTHSVLALTNAPLGSPGPAIVRQESSASHRSSRSIPSMAPPTLYQRGRSSTMGSLSKRTDTEHPSPQLAPSGRTSTSTTGRKSFGDIFTLSHRLRQSSEPPYPRHGSPAGQATGTPGSIGSKPNSFSMPRVAPVPVYPERAEDDTPGGYLEKLEAAVTRGLIASILCKTADEFSKTCLRKYMRGFSYFGDSIDMAVRKMLMEVELPKETQQIDRLLQGFANRYCECNPGIFVSTDEAYFLAFSILLLHSDTHNKNNKRKMQKPDYVKNTQDQVEVSQDILECFYDNVSYTPFIHFEDEVAVNSHRLVAPRSRKNLFRTPSSENVRGPVDPYTLILDHRLELLRPPLKDVMNTEDTYSSTGTKRELDMDHLFNAFHKSGVLQIVSARSRPDAFMTQATISNPADAQVGLVDIRAAKVGLLWRKDPKKKKTRSPWQEWGAILTSSQLYFFRDVHWVKNLIFQQENNAKLGNDAPPLIFKPPLAEFSPAALMSMEDAVALHDASYKKHKHAFTFIKHGGFEEVFLAQDEADMNDWIAKLNYAATFRTIGVRMRGQIGPVADPQRHPFTRGESSTSTVTLSNGNGQVQIQSRRIDPAQAQEIMTYRRQIMNEKIDEADERLVVAQKELENLLRNSRHLMILTPIQQKSREALVLAAGRMSAKLKWTRVEMWRTRCHREIVKLDLDQESKTSGTTVRRELSHQKLSPELGLPTSRRGSRASLVLGSPKSLRANGPPRSISQATVDRIASPEVLSHITSGTSSHVDRQPSSISLGQSAAVSVASAELKDDVLQNTQTASSIHSLVHKPSMTSHKSSIGATTARLATPEPTLDDEGEKQALKEAGLFGIEGTPSAPSKRPDTGESDQPIPASTETTPLNRSNIRRSLQRTLRDSSHHNHSHLPHHHRSKKGKDSNSSTIMSEDTNSPRPTSKDSEGLARGAGSFTLHGKKASVITFGSEWQSMSPDERLKLRKQAQAEEAKQVMEDEAEADLSDSGGPPLSSDSKKVSDADGASVKSFGTTTPTSPRGESRWDDATKGPLANGEAQQGSNDSEYATPASEHGGNNNPLFESRGPLDLDTIVISTPSPPQSAGATSGGSREQAVNA